MAATAPETTCLLRASSASTLPPASAWWHFQFVHHGVWDWDNPNAPILLDITVDGRPIKAVAQATKQAWLYVFDRVTWEPVWPIEERPVPQTDVHGEKTSPTQPFPTKPAAFDRQGLTHDDLIDFTARAQSGGGRDRGTVPDRADLHAAQQRAGRERSQGHAHSARDDSVVRTGRARAGDQRLTWTLTAHGEVISIPGHLRPGREITALEEITSGNTPPVLKFGSDAPPGQGPLGTKTELTAMVASPTPITVWATDDGVAEVASAIIAAAPDARVGVEQVSRAGHGERAVAV